MKRIDGGLQTKKIRNQQQTSEKLYACSKDISGTILDILTRNPQLHDFSHEIHIRVWRALSSLSYTINF